MQLATALIWLMYLKNQGRRARIRGQGTYRSDPSLPSTAAML
jgi:hypothetical protein